MTETVGIYIRVSDPRQVRKKGQDQDSPESQRKEGLAFAAAHGFNPIVYQDGGVSGGSQNDYASLIARTEFKRLFDDIASGQVQHVWARNATRISRDGDDASLIKMHLVRHRVTLWIGGRKSDLSDPNDLLYYRIESAFAERDRSQIAENMGRARRHRIDEGYKVKSRLFGYGYTHSPETGKTVWHIIPEQAAIIRSIYDWWVAGGSLSSIGQRAESALRAAGRGASWIERDLWRILTRPEYDARSTDTHGQIIESKIYPRIVDHAVWEQAQALALQRRAATTGKREREAHDELSAVVTCGVCGAVYKYRLQNRKYRSRRDGTKVSVYPREVYYHHRNLPRGECTNGVRTVYAGVLRPIMRALYEIAFESPTSLESWRVQRLAELDRRSSLASAAAGAIKARLADLDKGRGALLKAVEAGTLRPAWIAKRAEELGREEDALRAQLSSETVAYHAERAAIEDEAQTAMDAQGEFMSASGGTRRALYRRLLEYARLDSGILRVRWANGHEDVVNVRHPPERLRDLMTENTKILEGIEDVRDAENPEALFAP